eukprot:TRINITY_DN161_c0_g1_i7.p1 TRINITY_DN161_c0_g1~~TRINITY_DN161_c0_g1_i7.p1  ORF type:complete len:404 (+),score=59.01 TRINITY_DN161_c0_g1_i7:107-1318(+)
MARDEKYDQEIDINEELKRIAKHKSHSTGESERLKDVKKGDKVEIQWEFKWVEASIRKLHVHKDTGVQVSPQVQVVFTPDGYTKNQLRWFDRRDPSLIRGEMSKKKLKKRPSFGVKYRKVSIGRPPNWKPSKLPPEFTNPYKVGQWVEVKDNMFGSWNAYEVDRVEGDEVILRRSYDDVIKHNCKLRKQYIRKASRSALASSKVKKQKMRLKFEKSLKKFDPNWIVQRCEGDGNCLFRTIAWAVLGDQEKHPETRREAVMQMWRHRYYYSGFFWDDDDCGDMAFIDKLKLRIKSNGFIWGDHSDISALAEVYNINIHVYEWDRVKNGVILSSKNPSPDEKGLESIIKALPTVKIDSPGSHSLRSHCAQVRKSEYERSDGKNSKLACAYQYSARQVGEARVGAG